MTRRGRGSILAPRWTRGPRRSGRWTPAGRRSRRSAAPWTARWCGRGWTPSGCGRWRSTWTAPSGCWTRPCGRRRPTRRRPSWTGRRERGRGGAGGPPGSRSATPPPPPRASRGQTARERAAARRDRVDRGPRSPVGVGPPRERTGGAGATPGWTRPSRRGARRNRMLARAASWWRCARSWAASPGGRAPAVDGARISPYRSSHRRTASGLCPRSPRTLQESDADGSPSPSLSPSSCGPRVARRGG